MMPESRAIGCATGCGVYNKAKNDMYVAYHAHSSYRYSISMQVYFRYLNHLLRVVMVLFTVS